MSHYQLAELLPFFSSLGFPPSKERKNCIIWELAEIIKSYCGTCMVEERIVEFDDFHDYDNPCLACFGPKKDLYLLYPEHNHCVFVQTQLNSKNTSVKRIGSLVIPKPNFFCYSNKMFIFNCGSKICLAPTKLSNDKNKNKLKKFGEHKNQVQHLWKQTNKIETVYFIRGNVEYGKYILYTLEFKPKSKDKVNIKKIFEFGPFKKLTIPRNCCYYNEKHKKLLFINQRKKVVAGFEIKIVAKKNPNKLITVKFDTSIFKLDTVPCKVDFLCFEANSNSILINVTHLSNKSMTRFVQYDRARSKRFHWTSQVREWIKKDEFSHFNNIFNTSNFKERCVVENDKVIRIVLKWTHNKIVTIWAATRVKFSHANKSKLLAFHNKKSYFMVDTNVCANVKGVEYRTFYHKFNIVQLTDLIDNWKIYL